MPAAETPAEAPPAPPASDGDGAPPNGAPGGGADGALRTLTGEEQRLYDRQIRLWGVEAQRRLATAAIVIVGDVRAPVVQELAKNVVLAGIAKLTLHSPGTGGGEGRDEGGGASSSSSSSRGGLLGRDAASVVASLQAMNCLVDVCVARGAPDVGAATVVCLCGLSRGAEEALSGACRVAGVPCVVGRVAGAVGWFFVDAAAAATAGTGPSSSSSSSSSSSCSYSAALAAPWGGETKRGEFGWHVAQTILAFEEAHKRAPAGSREDVAAVLELYARLRGERGAACAKVETVVAAARAAGTSLPPVAAIVAGMWGRETIKLVSGDKAQKPIDNFFFFNAATSAGSVEKVGPK